MLWKTIVAIVLAALAAYVTHSATATIATFLVAMMVVLVVEGVRIVPQQSAWVVERLGKFDRVLEPGFNVIVPFVERIAYRHSFSMTAERSAGSNGSFQPAYWVWSVRVSTCTLRLRRPSNPSAARRAIAKVSAIKAIA